VIFVDTSAWFAATVPSDANHLSALAYLTLADPAQLLTTDYVIGETLTLLRMRGESTRARQFGQRAFEESICRIAWVERADVIQAWIAFEQFRDKAWSFTDCLSRTVMLRLGIGEAFAYDEHFRQFGAVVVLP
jgi:predicted nucleic acid-binding protein